MLHIFSGIEAFSYALLFPHGKKSYVGIDGIIVIMCLWFDWATVGRPSVLQGIANKSLGLAWKQTNKQTIFVILSNSEKIRLNLGKEVTWGKRLVVWMNDFYLCLKGQV